METPPLSRRDALKRLGSLAVGAAAITPSACASRTSSGEIVLSIWSMWSGGEEEAFVKVMRRYEELTPGVRIENLGSIRDDTKTIRAIVAGVPPDLFTVSDPLYIGPIAAQGALTPLDDHLKAAGLRDEEFITGSLSQCRYRGKLYAMPFLVDGQALMWNKKSFRDAGLDPEKPPASWEELKEFAHKLTIRKGEDLVQLGFAPLNNRGFQAGDFVSLMNLFGGKLMDELGERATPDDPATIAALEDYKQLIDDLGGANRVNAFAAGFGSAQGGSNPFFMGKVAMMFNGQWNPYWAQEYAPDLEYGVGPLPAPKAHPERTGAAWLGGNLFCLPVGAKHPEEAWKLQAWMQTPEAQRLFANEMHGIPNRKSVISEPSLRTGEPWRVQYGKFMDYTTGQFSSHFPVMPIANLYNTSMFDSVDMVTTGQKTAKQAMEDVKVRVQRELDRYR